MPSFFQAQTSGTLSPDSYDDTSKIVNEKEVIDIDDLPEGYKLPIAQWIDACTNDGELVCDVDAGVLVNRVLDAATVACRENRTVKI